MKYLKDFTKFVNEVKFDDSIEFILYDSKWFEKNKNYKIRGYGVISKWKPVDFVKYAKDYISESDKRGVYLIDRDDELMNKIFGVDKFNIKKVSKRYDNVKTIDELLKKVWERVQDRFFTRKDIANIDINTRWFKKNSNYVVDAHTEYGGVPIKDWDVDMFSSYVEGSVAYAKRGSDTLEILKDDPILTNIFDERLIPISKYEESGSGVNNDKNWKKYGSWNSALYDIWEEVKQQAGF